MVKTKRVSLSLATASVAALMSVLAPVSHAETLQEAIALAYRTNPTLLAQRANQRALDETVPQARAGLRPNIDAGLNLSYSRVDSKGGAAIDVNGDGIPDITGGGITESDSASGSISLSQVIYTGGRIGNAINAAEANVLAGRENLRQVEQQVLASVIQAYVDVQRDMEILRIRQENITVLRRQLDESNARFEVGEITRTDVAQSEARLAQSEADLANAQAQLSVSRAAYAAVVGQAPTDLVSPALPEVPDDFDVALDIGLLENPAVLSAEYSLSAAEARVAAARSEYLPSASLNASYGGRDEISSFDLTQRTSFNAGATISVPLFTGGLNSSRVAQAREQASAAQITVEGEKRTVLQNVSTAYSQVISSAATLRAGNEAVRAASVAAEGVRQEAQVGLRTTLDVLNQELELRAAQVTLASARRNEYVARAQLLAAMGRLSIDAMGVDVPAYDATDNYNAVRNRGALPWDGIVEAIDSLASPPILPARDQPDAPIDQRLKGEIVTTAPGVIPGSE